jgi:hypothetical protein
VSYRDRQRLSDIQAAIDAIRSHLQRGTLEDGLVFDAVPSASAAGYLPIDRVEPQQGGAPEEDRRHLPAGQAPESHRLA